MRFIGKQKASVVRHASAVLLICILLLSGATDTHAFSVLAHEAIIDDCWDKVLQPLLLQRFPNSTPEDLKHARAYAYGGSIVQDMGYYPFGSKFFSDLVHYVRSGDFIEALLRESNDLNEYAFALGAVAHYIADNEGHRYAVNRAVPILYPKLKKKYGDWVTFAQDPAAHLKTEFGFDVLKVAEGRYAPDSYHDLIGFEVPAPLLQRAFQDTYSLEWNSVFSDSDLAIGTFRRSVSSVIPKATQVGWQLKKKEIEKDFPGITKKKFVYRVSRRNYRKQWTGKYKEPGLWTKFLAFLIAIVPKIGPFKALAFRTPTPETEKMFTASLKTSIAEFDQKLEEKLATGNIVLMNDNFDTGSVTGPGEYSLADNTYAELMDRLAGNHFKDVTPQLREVLLAYYGNLNAPFATKKKEKQWAKLLTEINELKNITPASAEALKVEGPASASKAGAPIRTFGVQKTHSSSAPTRPD
jgi:hypothetical protein